MSDKRHPQFILAIDTDFFVKHPPEAIRQGMKSPKGSVVVYPIDYFMQNVQSHLVIAERHMLERNEEYVQLIPYVVIRKRSFNGNQCDRFFTYQRTSGVGESRLAGNISVGLGGHIDLSDVTHNDSVISLTETLMNATKRELAEEVIFKDGTAFIVNVFNGSYKFTGMFIRDLSDPVGRVHFGMIVIFDVDDHVEYACNEEELITIGFKTAEELLYSDYPIENWTKLVLGNKEFL